MYCHVPELCVAKILLRVNGFLRIFISRVRPLLQS